MLRSWLFKVARSRFAGFFIGGAFAYLSWLMPLEKHFSGRDTLIFTHPSPFWQKHWLAVPKKQLPTLLDLHDPQRMGALFRAIQQVTASWPAFTVLVNWGRYQDVPQLHFHLAVGPSHDGVGWGDERFERSVDGQLLEAGGAVAYPHPRPGWEHHTLITYPTLPNLRQLDLTTESGQQALAEVLLLAQEMIKMGSRPGYRLLTNISPHLTPEPLTFHLISGKKRLT